MAKILFSLMVFACALLYGQADYNSTGVYDQKTAASSAQVATYTQIPSFWPDSWRSGLSQAASAGGILLGGLIIFVGILWLLGLSNGTRSFRMCSLFGSCEKPAIGYNAGGNLQDPTLQANAFNDVPPFYPGYPGLLQKRSINFLAPMLKKLVNTFENMEQEKPSKKQ